MAEQQQQPFVPKYLSACFLQTQPFSYRSTGQSTVFNTGPMPLYDNGSRSNFTSFPNNIPYRTALTQKPVQHQTLRASAVSFWSPLDSVFKWAHFQAQGQLHDASSLWYGHGSHTHKMVPVSLFTVRERSYKLGKEKTNKQTKAEWAPGGLCG